MTRVTHRDFTEEELLNPLYEFYVKEGRRPMQKDFKDKIPSTGMIMGRYKSWKTALEKACVPFGKYRNSDFTKDELIKKLKDYYNETGTSPTLRGLQKKGYPSAHTYIKHFGSFKNALIEAELYNTREDSYQFTDTYTDDELLKNLSNFMKLNNLKKIPSLDYLRKNLSPGMSTYERRFGSVYNAFISIGFNIEEQREDEKELMKEEMKENLRRLSKMLNRTPTSRDIDEHSSFLGYSASTYAHYFGSIHEAQRSSGLELVSPGRGKSREDLLKDLLEVATKLGRSPTREEMDEIENVASSSKYGQEFGSWRESLIEAGLDPNNRLYKSSDGIEHLSSYEKSFAEMLIEKEIPYEKEESYQDYIDTPKKYRFDFTIEVDNVKYFVEIFGVEGTEFYDNIAKEKKRLCKKNGLKLICFYPKDIKKKSQEELYEHLINNIKSYHFNN